MVFTVMLDSYQQSVPADQWGVSFDGTLEECRQYQALDGNNVPWPKSVYPTRVKEEDHPVGGEAGAIYELTAVANFSANLDENFSRRLDPPAKTSALSSVVPSALVLGGFAAGLVAGLLLSGRVPNPFSGDEK